ncbi:protein TolR [Pseudoxanthomonas sp. JBR18]|uniref:protein TolR n=1 Tax=Pseudoxanthomonas sp. JBR18 TaxID=2969308 RepID=UPI00230609EE|nr:protein TolR [Pseudoxanthomonas sp. JBR18]WCE02802.1 protein TolR [Pseudoxanthomonas sp. JBR18]
MQSAISRHRKRRKLKSEINVVPYIDVMLVLLIIFMVTAPMLTLAVNVDIPKSTARSVDSKADPIIVTVDGDGRLFLKLQDAPIAEYSDEELLDRLRAFHEQNKDVPVFLAAPGEANYQRVIDATAIISKAGIEKVGLMSKPGGNAR